MPTDGLSPAQWALMAVQEGWSANRGLSEYRAAGGHVANSTWYKLTAEIQVTLANRQGIYNEPLNRIPTADEIKTWTTSKARGYIQQVEVLVRDKVTGEIMSIPFSLTGRTLRSRTHVLNEALKVYDPNSQSGQGQQQLGAVYTGTYEAIPSGE